MLKEHEVEITSLALGGDGICRIDGQVAFVPYGLPGDHLRVRIRHQARQVLWGELVEVLHPAPDRVEPDCPEFGRCGLCSWLHFAYPAQAEWKVRLVQETLRRIGRIEAAVGWREDPTARRGYRTRAEFHGDGKKLGFFARQSHDIVESTGCPLCHPRMNEALARLRPLRPKGDVAVTVNPEGEDILVWAKPRDERLTQAFPDGAGRSHFLFDGVPIVNGGFSQASLLLNRLLVAQVKAWAPTDGTLLDLYCGSGNLSMALAGQLVITGIDHDRTAVSAAAAMNSGAYRPGSEAVMAAALAEKHWDCILLDPPRTGAKALLPALQSTTARRIIYVSCDVPTLARDLRALLEAGWKLGEVVALDLFPNTGHVEAVCWLEREARA